MEGAKLPCPAPLPWATLTNNPMDIKVKYMLAFPTIPVSRPVNKQGPGFQA